MKRSARIASWSVLAAAVVGLSALALVGCGSGDEEITITGRWTGTANRSFSGGGALNSQITIDFVQNGTAVTGTYSDDFMGMGDITGTLTDNHLVITLSNFSNFTDGWDGTVNADGTLMTGTLQGTAVGETSTGTWTLMRIL